MKKFLKKHLEFFIVGGLIFMFGMFYMWDSIVVTVFPGHAGVKFKRFFNKGTVIEKTYNEGVHFVFPWDKMYIYEVRIQELKQAVEVLSQNGLTIKVVVSVRYHLLKDEVPYLHQKVGENYKEKVIIPSTISSVREVIGKYLPEELYTTARHLIQDEILVEAIEETGRLPIIYAAMIIEVIQLPEMINRAIETKLKHQQEFLEYQYKILKAEEEKKRLVIEATGIKQFQLIVAESLSQPLLTWQGIQATKDIAQSENSKIIIIGGRDGLPVILNTGDTPRASEQTPVTGTTADLSRPGKTSAPKIPQKTSPKDIPGEKTSTLDLKKSNPLINAIDAFNRKLSPDLPAYNHKPDTTKPKE